MFGRLVLASLMVVGWSAVAAAQVTPVAEALVRKYPERWFVGGATWGGVLGSGTADNSFEPSPGFFVELGAFVTPNWGFNMFGTGYTSTTNSVGSSTIDASFYTPYAFDVRWRPGPGGAIAPFVAFGLAWRRMHFERTEGASNQTVFSAGAGIQVRMGGSGLIQVLARPYGIAANDVGQSKGYDIQIGVGRRW